MRLHLPVPSLTRAATVSSAVAAALAAAVVGAAAQQSPARAVHASATTTARTTSTPPTELLGNGPTPIPLKNKAMVEYTKWGPRFIAGQQNSNLTVTYDGSAVTFTDLGTQGWRSLPTLCTKLHPNTGVAASCKIPDKFADGFFVQVWPRLGNDRVDGSTLPATVRFWVLADAGRDTVVTGNGDDFVNGAQDADVVHGGPGNDWLRTGKGNDEVWGDAGSDKIVCQDGRDIAHVDSGDRVYTCEKKISS